MAGPGGRVIGRVSIKVVPDSSDFAPELAGDLAAIERTLAVEVPVEVNARRLARDLGRIRTQVAAATRNVEVAVTADTTRAVAEIAAIGNVLPAVEVPVEVNLARATAELAAVERLAAGLNPTVRVGVAVDPNLRTRLSGLRSALSGGGGQIDPVLRTRMELLKARLTEAGAVELQVDVDVAAAVAKVEAAKRAVEAVEGPRIDIGAVVNREALQASLEDARQRLDELVKRTRSVRLGNDFGVDSAIQIPAALTLDRDEIRQDLADLRLRLINEFGGGLPVPFSFDQDVEGSLADLRTRVEQLVAGNEFEVPATLATPLNENRLFGDLAILSRRLAANGGDYEWNVRLTAEQDQLQRSLAELQQRITEIINGQRAEPLTVDIRPDDAFSANLRRQIRSAVAGVEASIPVTADGEAFRARLQRAVEAAEAALQVDVPLDVAQATLFRQKALAAVAQVQAIVDAQNPTIEIDVDVDRRGIAEQRLAALRSAFDSVGTAFSRLLRLTEARLGIERFVTQLSLILARSAAYAVLIGPPLVLAASGALALAPAFATALPFALGLAAQIGVIALGLDALFGAKQTGGGRLGGPFQNLRDQIAEVKVEIGDLLTRGLEPLSVAFQETSFTAFTNGLKGIAAATNLAITNFLLFSTTRDAIDGTEKVFAALTRQTTVFAGLVEPLAGALLNVAVAAIPGFDKLNGAIFRGGLRFAAFIDRVTESGQLTRVIDQSIDDLLGFLTGIGRITREVIGLLAALEPAARAAFGGIGRAVEGGLEAATTFIQNFQLSGSAVEGVLLGVLDVVASLRQIPGDILRAFAPLVESDEFDRFLVNLGALLVTAATSVATLTNVAANLVETFNTLVGVPLLGFLADITGGLAGTLDFLNRNEALFGTLAIILAVKYIPAVANAIGVMRAFVLVNIAGAISTALGAVVAFVRAIPAYIAGVRAFGTAAIGVADNLKAMAVAAVTSQVAMTAAFAGITLLAVSVVTDFQNAGQEAKASIEQIAAGFDALDPTALERTSEEIRKVRYETLAAGDGASFWTKVLSGPLSGRLIDAKVKQQGIAVATEATNAALAELEQKTANVNTNLAALVPATGATASTLREVAQTLGVDLSKAFSESGPERDKILRFMTDLQTQSGLTVGVLATFAESSGQSLQKVAKDAEDAAKRVANAFARDTDVLGTLDLAGAQEKLVKALETRTEAQKKLNDLEERLAGKKKISISDTQALEAAQLALADANKAVAESSKNTGIGAIRAAYKETIDLAKRFTTDIAAAYKAGLDPAVIARLLEAGPKQATPILEAILSDHSGRMVDLVNESEKKLAALNTQVLQQQRILWIAIQSEAAAGSDKYLLQVDDAMRVSAELFASGGTASINAIAAKLKLTPERVTEVAQNFGFTQLLDQLQGQANRNPIDIRFRVPKTLPVPGGGSRPNPIGNKPIPGGVPGLRAGGLVDGPGTKTSDSILRWLSRGEFVHQAAAVDHYGPSVMRAINEKRIPKDLLTGAMVKQLAAATKAVQIAAADVKAVSAVVARQPRAATADRVIGVDTAGSGALPAGYPRSLAVVDADGVLRGQMKVAASNDHKARMHRERRKRLGSQGGD